MEGTLPPGDGLGPPSGRDGPWSDSELSTGCVPGSMWSARAAFQLESHHVTGTSGPGTLTLIPGSGETQLGEQLIYFSCPFFGKFHHQGSSWKSC